MPETAFSQFIRSLSEADLDAYAKACGTSVGYLTVHLKRRNKTPRRELMTALVAQSRGKVTREDVLEHFYPAENFEVPAA